jgi:hypothetical protein
MGQLLFDELYLLYHVSITIIVNLIQVKSELPSTFKAYRHQQHRWTCGAANLFRKMAWEIITNKVCSLGPHPVRNYDEFLML